MHVAVLDAGEQQVVGQLARARNVGERDVHAESHATLLRKGIERSGVVSRRLGSGHREYPSLQASPAAGTNQGAAMLRRITRGPAGTFRYGTRTVEPVVLRASRSRCACAASFS